MNRQELESADNAAVATDDFYRDRGFAYTLEQVSAWLDVYLSSWPTRGNVLDLCCGDGIWSRGIKDRFPALVTHGIDISRGGIEKARSLLHEDAERFVVGDAEEALPWPDGTFDVILARGPGLFNQHSMDRPATIGVIEKWHRALRPKGLFCSVFYSDPERFGTYTNPLKVALPYNRAPRLTRTVDFTGGKFHHDINSFLTPFRKAGNVAIRDYRFLRNTHILHTTILEESDRSGR